MISAKKAKYEQKKSKEILRPPQSPKKKKVIRENEKNTAYFISVFYPKN